ncbi:MAG: amino acid ABC transporter permease [Rhodospirillales bacterium]|nr:amino acid ABC transporter permease [Rhodospirillales bacterium]
MTSDAWSRALALLPDLLAALLTGVWMTITVTVGAFFVSLALGLVFAACRTSSSRVLHAITYVYVELFRAVPVLTQLFIIYFGLAAIGIRFNPVPAAILGFGLNGGAYLTEVFRSGILAIHRGQTEAAMSLGMPRLMTLRVIVLPQASRIVLPSLANFAIGLLKETSLASAVAAPELSFQAKLLVDKTFLTTQIYILVAMLYLCMSLPLSQLARILERRAARGRRA